MGAEVRDERAASAPDKQKQKAPNNYTPSGRPRQRYLRELVAALPKTSPRDPSAVTTSGNTLRVGRSHANGDGSRRLGIGRANLRAYVREEAAKREPSAPNATKRLSRQAWRLRKLRFAQAAFRRFNPEGLASNQRLEQREAA